MENEMLRGQAQLALYEMLQGQAQLALYEMLRGQAQLALYEMLWGQAQLALYEMLRGQAQLPLYEMLRGQAQLPLYERYSTVFQGWDQDMWNCKYGKHQYDEYWHHLISALPITDSVADDFGNSTVMAIGK